MAVVPMQKIRIISHLTEVDEVLSVLQRHGAAEFHEVQETDLITPTDTFEYANILPRVQHAITYLSPFAPKVGMLQTLREGSQITLTESEIKNKLSDVDTLELIAKDVDAIQVEQAELTEKVRQLEEQREVLQMWKDLPFRRADLETQKTKTYLLTQDAGQSSLTEVLGSALTEANVPYTITTLDENAAALTVLKDSSNKAVVSKVLDSQNISEVEMPAGEEEPSIELVRTEQELAEAKGKLALVYDQAEHAAITHLRNLRVNAEILTWRQEADAVKVLGRNTKSTTVLEGWINTRKQSAVRDDLSEAAVMIEEIPLTEGEEPPVEIENNKWIQPFEAVTRLYGMPGHTDLDPTLFLAGFFFLFFGLSLTDVGYGLTLAVISGGLLAFAKLRTGVRTMMWLLLYIGIATVLVGLLFGGYFGIAPELLPEPLRALQQFDPIGNPLPVFYLALSLGVIQVMVGMVLKIYSDYRNGALANALWEQGPWLALFTIGIVYVLNVVEYVSVPVAILERLAYTALAVLVVGAIVRSSGILDAIKNIGGSLYASVGFLSDILSYSRLLALGLATTALAFAVNLIAGIVFDTHPLLGPVFALIILVIGHVFTLAVNTLGAFIHSARLQFVEFFGKFVAGSGRTFAPLRRSDTHVTVTRE